MAPKYAEFDALEVGVREYLGTLNDTALNDPEAPSPLAYVELQGAGRADLAEGCMKHGGYREVSRRLGVRVQSIAAPKSSSMPSFADFEEKDKGASVTLGAAAKEDRMAADLARLAANSGTAQTEQQQKQQRQRMPVQDRLAPLNVANQQAGGKGAAGAADDGPLAGIGRYIRLNGLQRACILLITALLAAGFGQTSTELLDASIVEAARLAGAGLGVGHVAIAGYGAYLAAQSGGTENPALWFFKLTLTGVGGLVELTSAKENQ